VLGVVLLVISLFYGRRRRLGLAPLRRP